jgi:hypothetical protein
MNRKGLLSSTTPKKQKAKVTRQGGSPSSATPEKNAKDDDVLGGS